MYTAHYTPYTWDTHRRHCCFICRCLSGRDTCTTSYGRYVPGRSFLFLPCKTYHYVICIYAIYITLYRVLSVRNHSISCFMYDIIYIVTLYCLDNNYSYSYYVIILSLYYLRAVLYVSILLSILFVSSTAQYDALCMRSYLWPTWPHYIIQKSCIWL